MHRTLPLPQTNAVGEILLGAHFQPADRRTNRATRALDIALLGIWALCVGAALWLVFLTSPYLPKFDDWPAMAPVVSGNQPVTVAWLWHPHVNHRIVLPRLAYLAAFYATGGDFRAGQFVSVGLMGLAALAGMGLARRLRGKSILADAFFPLIMLHWGQSQLYLLGTVLNFTMAFALNYGAVFLILGAGRRFNGKWAMLLLSCLAGLALSGLLGQLMAVPYLIWLGVVGCSLLGQSPRDGWTCLAAMFLGVVLVILPFVALPVEPQSQDIAGDSILPFLRNFAIILAMSLGWLGRSQLVLSLGMVLGFSLAVGGWLVHLWRTRPEQRLQASALLAFMFGVVAVAGSVAYGRSFPTDEHLWATTRYAGISVGLLVACYLASLLLQQHGLLAQKALCCLAFVVFVGCLPGAGKYPHGHRPQRDVGAHEESLIRNVVSGKSFKESAAIFFVHQNGYSAQEGAKWLGMLQDKQLGPFGMSESERTQFFDWWDPSAQPTLDLRNRQSNRFLGEGWRAQEDREGRWTIAQRTALRFRADPSQSYSLTLRIRPFVVPGKHDRQRVSFSVNGRVVNTLELDRYEWHDHKVSISATLLQAQNILDFDLPDTIAPKAIGYSEDPGLYGVMIESIEMKGR